VSTDPTESDLHGVIAEYLAAVESSAAPDRSELLRRYPDLADRLREFFADHDSMVRAAAPVRGVAGVQGPIPYTGDYILLDELGRGGMGVVYRARQKSLDRLVAVKVIAPGLFVGDEVRRFRAEAEAVAALDHPGIVPIYEVGEWRAEGVEPVHYFSMKLIDGGPLARQLDRFRTDYQASARLVASVARAVHHAHTRGILHRDLKPGNILLGSDGRAYVSDFGLARRLGPSAETPPENEGVVGTAGYMPPEQAAARSGHLSPASDVYSLGAILYAVLTGRPPFRGATQLETLVQVIDREPAAPRHLVSAIPADLETVILKCLDKRSWRRYETAAALADDLEAWTEGRPIRGRRVGPIERARLWCQRHPLHVGLATVAVLLALVPVLLLVRERAPHPDAPPYQTAPDVAGPGPVQPAPVDPALRRERTRARYLTYLQEMPGASAAWQAGDVAVVRQILDRFHPPPGEDDVRGWEWHHLDACCSGFICAVPHQGPVRDRQFHPDGTALALVTETHIERINLATGAVVWSVPSANAYRVVWAPDGHTLGALPGDGTPARLLDAATGKTLLSWRVGEYGVDPIAWRSDGKRLAVASDGALVRVCDADGTELFRLAGGGWAVAWSPDGKRIAAGGSIYDAETGRLIVRAAGGGGPAWSPDGRRLAVGEAVWDSSSGRKLVSLAGGVGGERQLRWSADGRRIFTDNPQNAHNRVAWDAETGRIIEGPVGDGVRRWSRDGRRLALQRFDALGVWDPESRTERAFPWAGELPVWSPDGKRLAVGGAVWELDRARPAVHRGTLRPSASAAAVEWAPGSRTLRYTGFGSASPSRAEWNPETDQYREFTVGAHPPTARAAWDPKGERVALGGAGGEVQVWDTMSGKQLCVFPAPGNTLRWISWSPDGSRVATLHGDSPIRLWDPQNPGAAPLALALRDRSSELPAPAWSSDGKYLAYGTTDRGAPIQLWEAATGREVETLRLPQDGSDAPQWRALAFSPDNKQLAARDSTRRAVLIWDRARPQAPALALGPSKVDGVWAGPIAWSPDSARLATVETDAVRIWDLKTRESVVQNGRFGWWVEWSPDGKYLAAEEMARQPLNGPREPNRGVIRDAATGKVVLAQVGQHPKALWAPAEPVLVTIGVTEEVLSDRRSVSSVVVQRGEKSVPLNLPLNEPPPPVEVGVRSPDGKYRAVHTPEGGTVTIIERATGRELVRLPRLGRRSTGDPLPMSWSPDGRLAALSEQSGELVLWSAGRPEIRCRTAWIRSTGSHRPPLFLWSAEGKRLVTAWDRGSDRKDSVVECWNPATGARVYDVRLPEMEARVLAGSPDGRWVVAGGGFGGGVLFAAETGEEKVRIRMEPNTTLSAVAWSTDSARFAVGVTDRGVSIWCPDAHTPLCRLPHARGSLAWSPDGRLGGFLAVWEGPASPAKK
jgi:WD40 repeat protein